MQNTEAACVRSFEAQDTPSLLLEPILFYSMHPVDQMPNDNFRSIPQRHQDCQLCPVVKVYYICISSFMML